MKYLLTTLATLLLATAAFAESIAVVETGDPVNVWGGFSGDESLAVSDASTTFLEGATDGGFTLHLSGPVLLSRVHLVVSGSATVGWKARKGTKEIDLWSRQSGDWIDLSGNGIVADELRLSVHGANLGAVQLSGLEVYGEDVGTVIHRVLPTEVKATAQTSFFFGPENLWDGNEATSWKVYRPTDPNAVLKELRPSVRGARLDWWRDWSGAFDARLDAVLPVGKRLTRIEVVFGTQASGVVELVGLISGQWRSMGIMTAQPSQRVALDNPFGNETVAEVQLISRSGANMIEADIGELTFWGYGNWAGDDFVDPVLSGFDAPGQAFGLFATDDRAAAPSYEFAIRNQTAPVTVEWQGRRQDNLVPWAITDGVGYYKVDVASAATSGGWAVARVLGVSGEWIYGRLHWQTRDGSRSWTNTQGTWNDGWKFLPSDTAVRQFPAADHAGGQFQLYGDGRLEAGSDETGWVEPLGFDTPDGRVYPQWPAQPSLRIVPGSGVGEVRYSGPGKATMAPHFEILWPTNGAQVKTADLGTKVLVGRLNSAVPDLKVNGRPVETKGSLFWIPLSSLGLEKGKMNLVSVSGTIDGQVETRSTGLGLDLGTLWRPGLGDGTIKTTEDHFDVVGQTFVPDTEVFVGNMAIVPNNGNLLFSVLLEPGVNLVPVKLIWKPTGAVLAQFTSTITSSANGLELSLEGGKQTNYVSRAEYTLKGSVSSTKRVKVTVGGEPIVLSGSSFEKAVTLAPGLNTVTAVATDSVRTVTKSVKIYYETRSPTFILTSPTAGQWFSKNMLVSGDVTDANPAYLWANGVRYNATKGHFAFPIPILQEGLFHYEFRAENKAGMLSDLQTVTLGVDNTPPVTFAISANVSGWTNNNRPQLSFATTDAVSGVARYDYRVPGAEWTTAVSPVRLPTLGEGVNRVSVRAVDRAGNITIADIDLSIDTIAPLAVTDLRGIPGNKSMSVAWGTSDSDVVKYYIKRTPAWSDGTHVTTLPEYKDANLANAQVYSYTVWAEDHAVNAGPQDSAQDSVTGLAVSGAIVDQPTIAEFENLKVLVPADALPAGTSAVVIKQTESPTLKEIATNPIVSPIYSITTLAQTEAGNLQETAHTELTKEVMMVLDYDPAQLPNGFPETNLGVYYFDTTWSKWFLVEKAAVDVEHKKVVFLTNHFTDFSVQPTMVTDLSPQQLKDAGHSPTKAESSAGSVTVSAQGGTSMTEVTDFVLQGKNGFTLPIKRMYDSTTALGDSPSLSLSASLSFGGVSDLLDVAGIVGQLVKGGVSGMISDIKKKISSLVKQNGDYALAAGVGWRLSLPYMLTTNSTIAVRLPTGGYYGVNQMTSKNDFWLSNPVNRELEFEFHEGEDFRFVVKQVRSNILDSLLSVGSSLVSDPVNAAINGAVVDARKKDPAIQKKIDDDPAYDYKPDKAYQDVVGAVHLVASAIPGWVTTGAELWTKDGTYYQFDTHGRVKLIRDKSETAEFTFHYNDLELDYIEDDMGRRVHFEYNDDSFLQNFARPVITRMWTTGFEDHATLPDAEPSKREVKLDYDWSASGSSGMFFNFLPTLDKSTDPAGRIYDYDYDQSTIVTGGGGIKVNFLALALSIAGMGNVASMLGVSALTLKGHLEINLPYTISRIEAPGIGVTEIWMERKDLSQFDFRPTDFFLGTIPTALEVTYDILFRMQTGRVRVISNTGVVRTTNYDFHWKASTNYNGTQYYVDRSTINDGRSRVIHHYDAYSKQRNRFLSWDDWLVASAQSFFQDQFYEVPEVYSLESSMETFNAGSGQLLETVNYGWNSSRRRLESVRTTRSSGVWSLVRNDYDNWGNTVHVITESTANGQTQKVEQWSWFRNTDSSAPAAWTLPGLSVTDEPIDSDIHDLPRGQLVRTYLPEAAGSGYQDTAHAFAYNSKGLKKAEALRVGTEWAMTTFDYYGNQDGLAAGAIKSRTGPLAGQKVEWTYDYTQASTSGPRVYTVTQTQSVSDVLSTVTTVATETSFDWSSGWKYREKNALGYLTEYRYDRVNRLTDTVKQGDEGPLVAGVWTVDRVNAPWEHITYDDKANTATVYRSVLNKNVTPSLGDPDERYTYDTVGQLIKIQKWNRSKVEAGTLKVLEPAVVSTTSVAYTPWGEVGSMTDPNGNATQYQYDAKGRLIRTTNADSSSVTVDYDEQMNTRLTTNERGSMTLERLNWNGQPLTRIDDFGGVSMTTTTYYDGQDRPVVQTDDLNQTTTTEYGPFGKPVRIVHPSVNVWLAPATKSTIPLSFSPVSASPEELIGYDKAGNEISRSAGIKDNWRVSTLKYDTLGRVIEKASNTRKEWMWYDAAGQLIRHADPLAVAGLEAKTLAATDSIGFELKTYSSRGQVLSSTDPTGAMVRYQYDLLDRKTQMKDPRSGSTTDAFTLNYLYDDLNRLVWADLPPVTGQVRGSIAFSYDARGNAVSQKDASERVTTWTYDARNRKTSQSVEAPGNLHQYSVWGYDAVGNVVRETLASSLSTQSLTSSPGLVTTKEYDGLNRLTATNMPDGQRQLTSYDPIGRPYATHDAAGNTSTASFNAQNKVIRAVDAAGGVKEFYYTPWGEVSASVATNVGGDQRWVKAYDALGQLTYEQNNAGQSWGYTYDPRGLIKTSTDPNGTTATIDYDGASRPVTKTLKNLNRTETQGWTYDLAGALKTATDGAVTTAFNQASGAFVPDPYDLVTSYSTTVGAKTMTLKYSYNKAHSQISETLPDATALEYVYNGLEQLTDVTGYASAGQYNYMGRLTSLQAANGTSRSKTWNPSTGTLDQYEWGVTGKTSRSLQWDNRGNLDSQTKDGLKSNYQYDQVNRLSGSQERGRIQALTDSSMPWGRQERDVAGRLPLDYSNPAATVKLDYYSSSVGVDLLAPQSISKVRLLATGARFQPRTVEIYISTTGEEASWTKLTDVLWKPDRTGVTLQLEKPHTGRYLKLHSIWDERDQDDKAVDRSTLSRGAWQLIQVWYEVNQQNHAWSYDAVGNRLEESITRGTSTHEVTEYYPNSNLVKNVSGWTFTYDLNGNMTKRTRTTTGETWSYTWDLQNRLTKVEQSLASGQPNAEMARYTYDIRGLRVAATKNNITTYYQYDQSGDLVWMEKGTQNTKYIQVLGQVWAEVQTNAGVSKRYYHHTDYEGTTNVVTDSAGKVVWDGEYEAFGALVRENGSLDFTPSYTGKQLDEETGLHYYNARWYDAELGRFISEDPIRSGENWEIYALANPLRYVDPTGLAELVPFDTLPGTIGPKYVYRYMASDVGDQILRNIPGIGDFLKSQQSARDKQWAKDHGDRPIIDLNRTSTLDRLLDSPTQGMPPAVKELVLQLSGVEGQPKALKLFAKSLGIADKAVSGIKIMEILLDQKKQNVEKAIQGSGLLKDEDHGVLERMQPMAEVGMADLLKSGAVSLNTGEGLPSITVNNSDKYKVYSDALGALQKQLHSNSSIRMLDGAADLARESRKSED